MVGSTKKELEIGGENSEVGDVRFFCFILDDNEEEII